MKKLYSVSEMAELSGMMVDLRSDTVTKPTKGMLKAMVESEVGDDVFDEDPTTIAFEKKMSSLFGFEAGLFVPSGVMSNQLALASQMNRSEEAIIDELGHIYNYETAAASTISNIQLRPLRGTNGLLNAELIESAIRTSNNWDPITSMICLEQTANKGGGSFYSKEELAEIRELSLRRKIKLHIDGARIWNAMQAGNTIASDYGELADSLSICFSKGLGAPIGSMLLSSVENIKKARRLRKMLGGGMRQIGLLTAAADYAYMHHFDLLSLDHNRAKRFAEAIDSTSSFHIDLKTVHTNIVLFDILHGKKAEEILQRFKEFSILMVPFGPQTIRATFHHQVDDGQLDYVLEILNNYF